MKKNIILLVFLLVIEIVLTSCSNKETNNNKDKDKKEDYSYLERDNLGFRYYNGKVYTLGYLKDLDDKNKKEVALFERVEKEDFQLIVDLGTINLKAEQSDNFVYFIDESNDLYVIQNAYNEIKTYNLKNKNPISTKKEIAYTSPSSSISSILDIDSGFLYFNGWVGSDFKYYKLKLTDSSCVEVKKEDIPDPDYAYDFPKELEESLYSGRSKIIYYKIKAAASLDLFDSINKYWWAEHSKVSSLDDYLKYMIEDEKTNIFDKDSKLELTIEGNHKILYKLDIEKAKSHGVVTEVNQYLNIEGASIYKENTLLGDIYIVFDKDASFPVWYDDSQNIEGFFQKLK